MEDFAIRVRELLDVPVALVLLVQADRQVFPGMQGMHGPWATRRSTPLTRSFCQHIVATAAPLVVEDARDHDVVRTNVAVSELGVIAYAGMPLTNEASNVLGFLCTIDGRPRRWRAEHLGLLRDVAKACSTELRLRLAKVDAKRERRRRDELDARLHRSYARPQTLLLTVRNRTGVLVHSDSHPATSGRACSTARCSA